MKIGLSSFLKVFDKSHNSLILQYLFDFRVSFDDILDLLLRSLWLFLHGLQMLAHRSHVFLHHLNKFFVVLEPLHHRLGVVLHRLDSLEVFGVREQLLEFWVVCYLALALQLPSSTNPGSATPPCFAAGTCSSAKFDLSAYSAALRLFPGDSSSALALL